MGVFVISPLPSFLLESLPTAGPLRSTAITPFPRYYWVGIELERAGFQVEGYQPRPFGCEVGSQFHHGHVSRGPPIMPDGQISRVRFEALAFLHRPS
jgi:hypothetical protein